MEISQMYSNDPDDPRTLREYLAYIKPFGLAAMNEGRIKRGQPTADKTPLVVWIVAASVLSVDYLCRKYFGR
jgi:hypothetical protein